MRTLVESMKRLYKAERITKDCVKQRVKNGKLTHEEYEFITGETYEDDEPMED